ncbi:MAG: hypothetical protein HQL46_16310 [Gammaproteobacteria bacterium]|nr:hypothetical protein [Gammaproteobacteria bacterium]
MLDVKEIKITGLIHSINRLAQHAETQELKQECQSLIIDYQTQGWTEENQVRFSMAFHRLNYFWNELFKKKRRN